MRILKEYAREYLTFDILNNQSIEELEKSIAEANIRQKELADKFELLLVNRGFSTRVFNPAGQDDIGGGCGQLWFVQDWMKEHPEKAKQSKGFGKEVIHSPK